MNWRECRNQAERERLRQLTCEPMSGRVQLVWGLDRLQCPPDCVDLRAYAIETRNGIEGCAMAWDWPGGDRYLSSLRFSQGMSSRPRPKFWKNAFASLLDGVDHGWTAIGAENARARRMLESGVSWLPHYIPRQSITTWFLPLPRKQSRAPRSKQIDEAFGIMPLDWRHIAVASGRGLSYRVGRGMHRLGLPGISPPNARLRVGDFRPKPAITQREFKQQLATIPGYDGLTVVLPDESPLAKVWRSVAPRTCWTWRSTLYSVIPDKFTPLPQVPEWKGYWL